MLYIPACSMCLGHAKLGANDVSYDFIQRIGWVILIRLQ